MLSIPKAEAIHATRRAKPSVETLRAEDWV